MALFGMQSKRDVAILEEPEHLNWFNHSQRWSCEFEHVVGIMHTNYVDYMRRSAGEYTRLQWAIYTVKRPAPSCSTYRQLFRFVDT